MPQNEFSNQSFILLRKELRDLKLKIEKIGLPIKRWDVKINFGIKTGYNPAFYINREIRDEYISKNKLNKEIIKPTLRGRDITRYKANFNDLWLLFIPWHFPLHKDNTVKGASTKAEEEFNQKYPEIYNHLLNYKENLLKRNKAETGKSYEWYALQRCASTYYEEFDKDKIVWQEIVQTPSFSYDSTGAYCDATTFIMTGKSIKFLLSVLNSKPSSYFFRKFYAGGGLGESGFRYKKAFLELLPVPEINEIKRKPFIQLVDQILQITEDNDYLDNPDEQAKVKRLEKEIDALVYKLYELTPEEIEIVEEFNKEN